MGLYRDETGRVIEIDDRFAQARGYTPLTAVEHEDINAQRGMEARGTERGALGSINAALTGVESALTLGGSDYLLGKVLPDAERERVLAEIEAHPYLRAGGEMAGTLGGALLPGLGGTPTGYLSKLAQQGVEHGLEQGGIAGTAKALASMGAEGGAQSVGQYVGHAALEDKDLTAEGLSGALGTGFAFGAGGGGAALGVANGLVAGRRMFSRVMAGEKAAKDAESTWSIASQTALEADQVTARQAEARLENIRKAKLEAQRARNEAKSAAQEAAVDASGYREPKPAEAVAPELEGPEPLIDVERPTSGQVTSVRGPSEAPDFEAGIKTDARIEKPQGGMPTSVFKKPVELEGPEPLVDVTGQPSGDGGATAVFKKPASEEQKAAAAALFEKLNEGKVAPKPVLPKSAAEVTDETVSTVSAKELEAHGFESNSVPGKDKVKTEKGEAAIKEGQKDPIKISVSPSGKYVVEDGTHRLAAAIKQGKEVKVQWFKGAAGLDEAAPSQYVVKGKPAATLEEQLAGTKKALDEGAALKDIKGEKPAKGKAVKDASMPEVGQIGRGQRKPGELIDEWLAEKADHDAARGVRSDADEWLSENRVGDPLSEQKKWEDIKGASELRNRRQETLREIRYKATEELLGPQMAKEEARIADIVEEYQAARKEIEELVSREAPGEINVAGVGPESNGVPELDVPRGEFERTPRDEQVTGQAVTPAQRQAIAILDDAHEEALLRVKHAADPQEAGQALSEAEELEKLLEGLQVPRLHSPEHPLSARELRSASAKAWADEMQQAVKKIERYERASAALADEVGDSAHAVTVGKAKMLRDAEKDSARKVTERTARATDDVAEMNPKERAKALKQEHIRAQSKLDEMKVQHSEAAAEYKQAKQKVSAGESAKKAALKEDAKRAAAAGSAANQAFDVGGLLEMGIPGLPKPSDLPVVGPLLGAYIKYRAMKKAMMRGMGTVPATADARVAVLASQTRDRVARAVDRSLGVAERGARVGTKVLPPVAGVLAHRIYDDGGPDPKKGARVEELAAARLRELASYVHTPNAIERDVRRELVGVTDPDLIAAAEKQRRAAMEFLLSVAPKMPDQNLLNPIEYRPSPGQAMSFARSMHAVNDPADVFERLAHEQAMISLEAAEALRRVYPRIFSEAGARLMERAQAGDLKVPMRQRVQLSLLYKVPLDTSLDPVNLQITQSVYDRKPATPAPMPASPPQPSIANPVNISQAMTTSIDRSR